jgi:uncharacterized protein (TIGR03435 family)
MINGALKGSVERLTDLTAVLSAAARQMIVDGTGLEGAFEVDMTFDPSTFPGHTIRQDSGPSSLPTFADALRDELGLMLATERRPVRTLVVDHVGELVEQ